MKWWPNLKHTNFNNIPILIEAAGQIQITATRVNAQTALQCIVYNLFKTAYLSNLNFVRDDRDISSAHELLI